METIAVISPVRMMVPNQKPSANLSPTQNIMSATFNFYGLVRLEEVDDPGLYGIFSYEKDGVLAIELSGDSDSWKGRRCHISSVAGTYIDGGLSVEAVVLLRAQVD